MLEARSKAAGVGRYAPASNQKVCRKKRGATPPHRDELEGGWVASQPLIHGWIVGSWETIHFRNLSPPLESCSLLQDTAVRAPMTSQRSQLSQDLIEGFLGGRGGEKRCVRVGSIVDDLVPHVRRGSDVVNGTPLSSPLSACTCVLH